MVVYRKYQDNINIYWISYFIGEMLYLYDIIIILFYEKSIIFENKICMYNHININTKL